MASTYLSEFTGIEIDTLLSKINTALTEEELQPYLDELLKRLQGSSSNQDGYKDPVFYKEFVGSATLEDMNTWLNNQFFAIKSNVYYRNGVSGTSDIAKDVPQCLIHISYQGVKIYVFNSPRSFATGTFEQFAIGATARGNGITWGSHIMRRESTYDFATKKATWTAWEKISSDVDKSYVDTQLAKKVDKVSGKGLSTNDYTTAEKNLVATIPDKADKTYVDTQLAAKANTEYVNAHVNILATALETKANQTDVNSKFAQVKSIADNAAYIRTEDMQYMGVAFDRDGYSNGAYDTSADVSNLSVGDTFDYTDGYDSRGNISAAITIYDGETIVASATALLCKFGPGIMKILTKSGADGICVYKCEQSSDEVYLYGYGAEYRIYKKPYVLGLEGIYKKVDEISSNYVDAPTFIAATNGLDTRKADKTYVDAQLDTKVSKIAGKGLSTNDFSNDYKAKVDNYSAGVIYNYIDGLTYIYKSDDNIASAGVGDNISIYDDERGNISNFFSIEPGSIIVCDNNPILEYVSPSQLCVLAVPDATGKCTYSNNTGSTRDICVLVNSNARMEVSLSSIQTAIRDANKVAQKVENLANAALSQVALLIPESLSVEAPKRLTWGNKVTNYIKAVLAPSNVVQNIIYISDNKAVEVGTDGSINVIAKGISRVHVIPTNKTALAKTIQIEVGDPRLRISAKTKLRFTANGSMRLT